MSKIKAYGDCEGPFGFPMKSEVAKEIEGILKNAPAEIREIGYKQKVMETKDVALEEGERSDISFVTTDAVDSDREVMDPKGADWTRFQKAGMPVTWAHDYGSLPIGRGLWVQQKRKGWLGKTQYHAKPDGFEGNWFPDVVWWYVQNKLLRGKSIGFLPLKAHAPTPKEIEKRADLANVYRVFDEYIVLEWAVPPIQSNPDALVQATSKAKAAGLDSTRILKDAGLLLPSEIFTLDIEALQEPEVKVVKAVEPEPREILTASDVRERVAKAFRELDVKQVVQDEINRLRGRVS